MACAAACLRQIPAGPPPAFTQIRQRYVAQWNDLGFLVENGQDCWTLQIQSLADRKVLYNAQRVTWAAARSAAIEFAIFHAGFNQVALTWKEQW